MMNEIINLVANSVPFLKQKLILKHSSSLQEKENYVLLGKKYTFVHTWNNKTYSQHTIHVIRYIPYCAHFGQLIDSLKPVVDGLREESGELLVVEDLEAASGGNLANCCRMKTVKGAFLCHTIFLSVIIPMVVVTVPGLDKYRTVRETLCIHLASNIVKVYS